MLQHYGFSPWKQNPISTSNLSSVVFIPQSPQASKQTLPISETTSDKKFTRKSNSDFLFTNPYSAQWDRFCSLCQQASKIFFPTLFWYQTLFCGVFHEWNEWKIQLFQSNSLYRMNFLFKCYGNAFGTNISIDFGKLMYVSHSYIIHCSNS